MEPPDKRLFEVDIGSGEFRNGVVNEWWDLPDEGNPASRDDVAADDSMDGSPRPSARGHRTASTCRWTSRATDLRRQRAHSGIRPPSPCWTPRSVQRADLRAVSRRCFRTDWKGGRTFYHPYDRVAAQEHPTWPTTLSHLVWTADRTIVDYLVEFHALLNSGDYLGI